MKTIHYFRYDVSSGRFTANRRGLYHFTLDATVEQNKRGVFNIRRNDTPACWTFGEALANDVARHTGCSTTLELESGDYVDAYLHDAGGFTQPLNVNLAMTSFTGFMIQSHE